MDVRQAVQEYLAAKRPLSKATQQGYKRRLLPFVTWCEEQGLTLEQLIPRHIRAYTGVISQRRGQKGDTLTASTVALYVQTVKQFLSWCLKEEDEDFMIAPKLVSRIQLPKADQTVIETFTPEHLDAFFRAAEKRLFPVRDKAILCLLIDTGIRAGELVGLRLDCIWLDADDSYIKVTGKGRKEREVAVGRTARLALRRYITRYRKSKNKGEQHVFLSRTGEPLTVRGLQQIIEHLAREADIKGVRASCHTFRHTYACAYLLNGGDIYKLSRLMGHTSVRVTERYLRAIKARQARDGQSVLDHLQEK